MAEWPTSDELKKLLDVDSNDFDDHLVRLLEAAIEQVKGDVGEWDEAVDIPTPALRNAALRAAMVMRPNAESGGEAAGIRNGRAIIQSDAIYNYWLKGHRRRFGIA